MNGMKGKGKISSMKRLPKSTKKSSSSKKTKNGSGLNLNMKNSFENKLTFFRRLDAGTQSSMEVAKLQKKFGAKVGIFRYIDYSALLPGCFHDLKKIKLGK